MDLETFKTTILPLQHKLYRFSLMITQDTNESEDIVQDVFIKLWNNRNDLTKYRSMEALAMTMIKNKSIDYKKSKRSKTVVLDNFTESVNSRNPEKITEQRNEIDILHNAIRELPELQRMIVSMRDVEGMDFEEISEILEVSVNTIRVNLSRARKKLREKMMEVTAYGQAIYL